MSISRKQLQATFPISLLLTLAIARVCCFQTSLLFLIHDYRSPPGAESETSYYYNNIRRSATAKKNDVNKDINPFTRASWYVVEAFGKVFAAPGNETKASVNDEKEIDLRLQPSSLQEALRRIEMDNARSYFLSGDVDVMAYDKECIFADPFVSFSGRQRFVDNLSNLGSFITNYDAKMIKYEVMHEKENLTSTTPAQVKTKLMVKLELNLPWKPVLAWPWGVTYTIDPDTFLITNHVESWDVTAWDGVKQIFRKPTVNINK